MQKHLVIFALLCAAALCCRARSSPEQWRWSLYDLLKREPLVILGEPVIDHGYEIPGQQLAQIKNATALFGAIDRRQPLYCVSNAMTTGAATGPALHPSYQYLLFLTPVSDPTWALVSAFRTDLDRQHVYEIVDHWKGAICIGTPPCPDAASEAFRRATQSHLPDPYPDLANQAIRRQYGIIDSKQVQAAVQQCLALMQNNTPPAIGTEPTADTNPIVRDFIRQKLAADSLRASYPPRPLRYEQLDPRAQALTRRH